MIEILQLVSSFMLGLLMGGLLAEAFILVPYWRKMDPRTFLDLHGSMGPQLFRYFAPLTVVGTMMPIFTLLVRLVSGEAIPGLAWLSAILVLAMLAIYFTYFKGANASFASGTVGVKDLAGELNRWANWHWLRTALGLLAFLASLTLL